MSSKQLRVITAALHKTLRDLRTASHEHRRAQVGLGSWTAPKLRQKAVQWLSDNGERPMDDGKVGEQTLLRHSVRAQKRGTQ